MSKYFSTQLETNDNNLHPNRLAGNFGGRLLAYDLTDHLQQSARGSLILMIGQVTSTIITAIATILVARFLGSTSYGQVALAMIPITLANLFTNPGIRSSLIKFIAQYRTENRASDIRTLIITGLLINSTAGLAMLVIIFISSGFIAREIFNQSTIQLLIQIASANLIAHSLMTTTRSIFVGYERMEFYSLTIIVQSLLKSFLAPLLVYLGMGPLGAILGTTASTLVTGGLGLALVLLVFLRKAETNESTLSYREASRILLSHGFPLFLSILLSGAISQIYNFLMAIYVNVSSIGNYQAATNFTALITFFTMPISTVLFPLFSKLEPTENHMLGIVYQNSVKYAALMTVPVTMAIILLADPIVQIIYGNSYPQTAFYLQLISINFLFIGLGSNSNGSLLNGQGKTRVIFISNLFNLLAGLPLGLYLIPKFGIIGLIATLIIAPKTMLFNSLWWIRKNLGFSIDWSSSAKIFLSSGISFIIAYYLLKTAHLGEWTSLILGFGAYTLLYIFMLLKLGTLEISDVYNLRRILSSLGPLTPIFNIFLKIIEKYL
ncbi:MAG: oligosaccharide flippase family protein [Candidatus Bathyarchaeota archaeon]|nr:MAG: oligosaccharide flippase family protein [Candidatus Bathyarchaeota archaeon]